MNPKVTIIMATYNRAHFIMETLLSVQNQTFKNWECLIVDDGGTDNTQEVIAPILEQDTRFQFVKRPDKYIKGLPGCRNYGLDLSKGEYIIFFDDDDIVHPQNLELGIEVVETKNSDFCHYQKESFELEKPIIEFHPIKTIQSLTVRDIEKVITQKIGLASCTVLWKKYCFETIRFNESLLYAEEWECYTRIVAENFNGKSIDTILYYNRKHSNSNTGEFYRNNSTRRASYSNAVLLVVQNLKEKQLLSTSLKRYFISLSRGFSEYNLFQELINVMDLPTFEKIKWHFFYFSYPLRLPLYKIKKQYKENTK